MGSNSHLFIRIRLKIMNTFLILFSIVPLVFGDADDNKCYQDNKPNNMGDQDRTDIYDVKVTHGGEGLIGDMIAPDHHMNITKNVVKSFTMVESSKDNICDKLGKKPQFCWDNSTWSVPMNRDVYLLYDGTSVCAYMSTKTITVKDKGTPTITTGACDKGCHSIAEMNTIELTYFKWDLSAITTTVLGDREKYDKALVGGSSRVFNSLILLVLAFTAVISY